jgi:O-antigen ligase
VTAAPFRSPSAPYQGIPTNISSDVPGSIDTFQRIGYGLLVFFLFLIFSRIFDVKFSSLHLPGITYRIILAMVLLSRAFLRALKTSIGRALLFFTFWMACCVPTSVWRGGSWLLLRDGWFFSFVVFLATAGLIVNFQQCRKATYTVAWAFLALTVIARFWGSTEETGRLFLPNGKFSNPNEMAQALLLGMPLWWMVLLDAGGALKKVFAAGVMFFMLVMVSKCGSRGALIAFAVTVFCVFMRAPIMGKLKLIVGGFLVLAVVIAIMPGKLLRRYTTFNEEQTVEAGLTTSDYDAALEGNAVNSTKQRQALLKTSLRFTIQHPLFGVGPGMFTVAEDADAKEQGKRRGSWQGTHNSYTQVSSEMGFPGAIAYIAAIIISLKRTSRLHARTKDDPRLKQIANSAICLHYCLVVYAVSVFFDYIAYSAMLSVFGGLAAALDVTSSAEIQRLTAGPANPEPVPFEQFRPNWRTTAGLAPQV